MIVVIEGGDQAGKKTQSQMLADALKKQKIKTKIFSFPDYTTPIGIEIKKILEGKRRFQPQVMHCLLAANRWEKLSEILNEEKKKSVLIMNRYYQSNLVYGLVNKMRLSWLENLDAGMPEADLVILLDISRNDAVNRKKVSRDIFEKDKIFSEKILKMYKKLAKKKHWHVINASRSKQQVHQDIVKIFTKNENMKK